ncbi:head decoration protein [Lamprobacter modestohalophilus]|uniref:head decoration protein n=1 Tax=Lamprobacter modestohalophilus TaxID=1064514 RepID=UPI002ADEDF9E|nr:head decoration protein [Lamprobacter modestohalophilus]MEA1052355.1 head decoration protein [Lamprobacter modestohalophilus]
MPTLQAPPVMGDLIKREFDRDYNREAITLKAGTAYPQGAVLGRVTADGLYTLSSHAEVVGLEGAELASAVLLEAVDASAGDAAGLALVRGPVILADVALSYHASVDDPTKQAAKQAELAAYGLVTREAL